MSCQSKSKKEEIENTMACSAYAEAGEPCPLDAPKKTDESAEKSLEKDFACTAFTDQNEECPIGKD